MILLTLYYVTAQQLGKASLFPSSGLHKNQSQLVVTKPWLGVSISNITAGIVKYLGLTEFRGVLVNDVSPGSPAEKAGIQYYDELSTVNQTQTQSRGDVILAIDNRVVTKVPDLNTVLQAKKIGDKVNITLLHDNETRQVSIILAAKPAYITFDNPTYGISIQYPSNWQRSERGPGLEDVVGFAPPVPNSFVRLFLSADSYLENTTLDKFTNATINYMKTDPNFRLIESNSTILADGQPAHRLLYTFTNCAVISTTCTYNNEYMRIWTVGGNKVYTIRYEAQKELFPSYLPIVQKMIDSFKINSTIISQAENINNTNQFLTYENVPYGIRIQHPVDWVFKDGISNIGFVAPLVNASDETFTGIFIATLPAQHMTLAAYTNASIKNLTQQTSVQSLNIIQSSATTLAGSPAHKILFTAIAGSLPVKDVRIWTIKNNRVYQITYSSEPSRYLYNLPIAQKMIDSFE